LLALSVLILALRVSLPNSSPFDSLRPPGGGPILCYVSDRRSLSIAPERDLMEALLAKISAVAAAGVEWIQLREKDLSGRDFAALARSALQRVSALSSPVQPAARILLNDRLDVALAENVGGVHLGEDSLPVHEAKRLLLFSSSVAGFPQDFLVGASCHSLDAAKSAASAGASYIFFGPVFATPSKAVYGAPQGLDRLAEVCRSISIPVLAIGGITLENASSCFSAGASGIAAIRLFQNSVDPAAVVRAIRRQFS
ncbi:MAG: thiamine phosphate synthase, partial [Candidatus Acidiferrum sp.]